MTPGGGRRAGAGRPRSVGGRRTVTMGLVLSDDLKADLRKAAGELGVTEGEVLRRAARFALTHRQQLVIIRGGGRHGKKDA